MDTDRVVGQGQQCCTFLWEMDSLQSQDEWSTGSVQSWAEPPGSAQARAQESSWPALEKEDITSLVSFMSRIFHPHDEHTEL